MPRSHADTPCVLNPAPVRPELLALLELGPILTPNATELVDLVESWGGAASASVEANALEVARRTGAAVVVTLGGEGVVRVGADGGVARFPARATVARDTTGAGDTFNGVLRRRGSRRATTSTTRSVSRSSRRRCRSSTSARGTACHDSTSSGRRSTAR